MEAKTDWTANPRKIVAPGAMRLPGRRARLSRAAMANPGTTDPATLMAHGGVRRAPTPRLTLFDRPGFLSPDLCARLITLIDRGRRPSTIADPNGDDDFRTSETCDLPPE